MEKSALVWLRRDLRLNDHAALSYATNRFEKVYIVFVYDQTILDKLVDRSDRRVQFIHESLSEIHSKTGALITILGDPITEVPRLGMHLKVDEVVAAHDDDPYALHRDSQVKMSLPCPFISLKDHVVMERTQIVKDDGTPYRVFTPYSRAWRTSVRELDLASRIVDSTKITPPESLTIGQLGNHDLKAIGFSPRNHLYVTPGETSAQNQLKKFIPKLATYAHDRDYPAIVGVSELSTHLRFGTISVRECFRVARSHESGTKWETELIWREFYHMLLSNFPELGSGFTFQPHLNNLPWPGNPAHLEYWKEGKTGYPLVDAAMRCFKETGWMHNRLRMLVAMFLTKDLLLDWRLGEKYFADYLLDFELASNNGGWQWSASTGADAQPYFRIFNPILQSKKFDSNGDFIRRWVPELAHLDSKAIHWPFAEDGSRTLETPDAYPNPIVNHFEQKSKAIELFKLNSGVP